VIIFTNEIEDDVALVKELPKTNIKESNLLVDEADNDTVLTHALKEFHANEKVSNITPLRNPLLTIENLM